MLLVKLELINLPLYAPLCQSTAPPLRPARLSSNIQLLNVVLLQSCVESPCKNTAPPRYLAKLSLNVELSTTPKLPIQSIAPPSPPPTVSVTLPVAMLFVNVEFLTVPFKPDQYMAPPDLLAKLLLNIHVSTTP